MAGESLKESMVGMEKGSNAKCATRGTDSSSFDAGNASWMGHLTGGGLLNGIADWKAADFA
ncbi:hypothetical protein LTR74_016909 [Friedmanniomyces endolithicus]|nr:hypothetical protein LTR74_016909 [Friedmanniomyces endolithicus]